MKARIVGPMTAWILMVVACAPLHAAPAGWEEWASEEAFAAAGDLASAEGFASAESYRGAKASLLRRQPSPTPPRRPLLPRRMRKNTVSLGGQFSFGFVRGSSELNDHFDNGLGYAFRFRYNLSSRVALGFSFENQRYGSRAVPFPQPPLPADSQLVVTTVAGEGVVYFQRDKAWTPYILGGLGFASPSVTYEDSGARRVNEGPFVVIGGGVEKFVRPRLSLDFSMRGYAELGNSELSLFSQFSAGIHIYPGD